MQLDLFAHSRDRVLINMLAEALSGGDLTAARSAVQSLRAEFPDNMHLAPAALLTAALEGEAAVDAAAADHRTVLAARRHIETELAPAALAVLGRDAAPAWLASRWRHLAQRARALDFDAAMADAHAATLHLQAGAWADAATAVRSIEAWRRRPLPLAWMAQASWFLSGPDATWPLLAELAWLAPERLPALLQRLPAPTLHKLARGFEDGFDGTGSAADWAWWPAWLLVQQPLLAAALDTAQTDAVAAPERGFKLLQSLLRLERQGRHTQIVEQRRALRALHPGLFAAYMTTR